MVIVANEYENSIKELRVKSDEFKYLISKAFTGIDGCIDTNYLTKQLLKTYVAILDLDREIDAL